MPGITGIISKRKPQSCKNKLRLMIEYMLHEPFYNSNKYVNEEVGVYAGVVCHVGSFTDCMPVYNEKRDLVLLFSGESFADKEVASRLKEQGHQFDAYNASYLIHLYEEDEVQFFRQLNGLFNGLLIDLRANKVILFNDRYGMQRIYFHENKEAFIFSSEAKSLLKICPELREIDMQSLGEFFSCGCVLQNKSIFSEIFLLPGGSAWTFHKGFNVEKNSYFKPEYWENQPVLEKGTYYEKLREKFLNVLPNYFDSIDTIAMSVTGGLDSRMILSSIDSSRQFTCYTFGGIYRDCLDVNIGRKVAAVCNKKHKAIRIDNDFFRYFSKLAEKTIYLTDGCHHICGTHDVLLASLARNIASVRVTGKFGGEVLRSVSTFKATYPSMELFDPGFYKFIDRAGITIDEISNGQSLSNSLFKGIPWNMYGCYAAEQSQLTMRAPFLDNDFVGLVYQAPKDALFSNEISLRLLKDNNPRLDGIMSDRGFGGRQIFLLSKIKELFYYTLFKLDWYYGVGMPDRLIKFESKCGIVQLRKLFLGTQRIDHYRMWFQEELSSYVREILLDRMTLERPYFNKYFLEHMVESHIGGNRNYVKEIDRALTVELIQRLLIENI